MGKVCFCINRSAAAVRLRGSPVRGLRGTSIIRCGDQAPNVEKKDVLTRSGNASLGRKVSGARDG